MGQFSKESLTELLNKNVVELTFQKRTDGTPRRMLCTNNKLLLNSMAGKIALGFKPPKGVGLKYSPLSKGLVVTWDLFWQDYRQISIRTARVVTAIPLESEDDLENFWEFFNAKLQNMSSSEKIVFMGR